MKYNEFDIFMGNMLLYICECDCNLQFFCLMFHVILIRVYWKKVIVKTRDWKKNEIVGLFALDVSTLAATSVP